MTEQVKMHEEKVTATAIMIVPNHDQRTESAEFRKSVQRLKDDGHYYCWMSGLKEGDRRPDGTEVKLQVHHCFMEWCLAKDTDFEKLKLMCEEWDIYGYGRLMKNIPMTSIDDVRQMIVRDQVYHTGGAGSEGIAHGIHYIPFPYWIAQKIALVGKDPIPDDIADLKKELEAAS